MLVKLINMNATNSTPKNENVHKQTNFIGSGMTSKHFELLCTIFAFINVCE